MTAGFLEQAIIARESMPSPKRLPEMLPNPAYVSFYPIERFSEVVDIVGFRPA